MTDFSIIIPAYNEEDRLGATLRDIADQLEAWPFSVEVLVVDDGSEDRTAAVAREASSGLQLRVINTPQNRGKGHAVRTGMLAAVGVRRLFTDADGSTPIDEMASLDAALTDLGGNGVAIASIAVPGCEVLSPQSRLRSLAGRIGNRVIQALVLPGIRDSQRGFKLFSAEAADHVFRQCEVDGWAFDVEALAIARRGGYEVVEVPVRWEHRLASRVRASSYPTTLRQVWRIRRRIGKWPASDSSRERATG